MPTHKGIKLSIISQWELKIHPEFPHPDSSQFTFRSPDLNNVSTLVDCAPPSASSDSKADRLLGRQSTVSVYIPSLSGTRFWIRYSIIEADSSISPWYYFKLYMNGRHVTSWGTNSSTKSSGQVMRALFEPSERWNYKDNGMVYKNNGTESRPFFFANEVEGTTAAEDGGLVEVMVYRAKGRRRRVEIPEAFKIQEKYGIVMPSGGLFDKPQEAKFYDWHLIDPKDKPFATFQFHYRSWDSLIEQQLVPIDNPRTMLPATPSLLSLNGQSLDLKSQLEEENDMDIEVITVDGIADEPEIRDSMSSSNSDTPWMTTVFDDNPDHAAKIPDRLAALFSLPRTNSSYSLHRTVDVPVSKFSEACDPLEPPSSPQQRCWGDILNRPLPEIPTRGASLNYKTHSRNSSTISHCPSIAPSLRSYFERDTLSPEPVIGVASVVPIGPALQPAFGDEPEELNRDLISSTEGPSVNASNKLSPAGPTNASKRRGIASPPFSLSNITLRKSKRTPSKLLSAAKLPATLIGESPDREPLMAEDNDTDVEEGQGEMTDNMTTLSLTESEWMCRTPSPVRNDPELARVEKPWSPRMDKHQRSPTKKKLVAGGMHAELRASAELFDDSTLVDNRVRIRSGNWI